MTAFERDWKPEEEAMLDDLSGKITGEINGLISNCSTVQQSSQPITMQVLIDAYDHFERTFFRGIHITKIVPPAEGWPIAFYCPICKETTFLLSPWSAKPTDGDYFKVTGMCASGEHCLQHCIELLHERRSLIEILPSAKRPLV